MKIGRLFAGILSNPVVAEKRFIGIHFDSRQLQPGEIFLAIQSESNDGHRYVETAVRSGAAAAIVRQDYYDQAPDSLKSSLIPVSDPLAVIRQVASNYLGILNLKERIAITGSNGKTSTKEFLYQILKSYYPCAATIKNFNNQLGLIYSILKMPIGIEYGIFEIGTNHPGEIAPLAELIRPTIGIITGIGYSHVEFFHDLESIAREKCSMFHFMQGSAIAVYRAENALLNKTIHAIPKIQPLSFSLDENFQAPYTYRATEKGLVSNGQEFNTPLDFFALHSNLAAAITCARILKMPDPVIQTAVNHLKLPDKRLNLEDTGRLLIMNDCYNANPDSMTLALQTMARISIHYRKKVWLILADMLELGQASENLHRQIGKMIANHISRWKGVLTCGTYAVEYSKELNPEQVFTGHYPDNDQLWRELSTRLESGDIVLVKGSRGMKLDGIVEELRKW